MRHIKETSQPWIKLTGLVLIAVFVLVVLGLFRQYTKRSWDGKTRFTKINASSEGVVVESFDLVNKSAIRFKLPNELEMETIQGKGKWKVSAMPALSDKYGWDWVADSVADYLGISYTTADLDDNVWDQVAWWRYSRNLNWKEVTLEESGLILENRAADGEMVLGISSTWEQKAKEWFGSLNLANTNTGILIVNTTKTAGLGSHAARVIESAGLKVNRILSQEDEKVKACEVWSSKEIELSLPTNFLMKNFKCVWYEDGSSGSDIRLILGQDYKTWLLGE